MKFVVRVEDTETAVEITRHDDQYEIDIGGKKYSIDARTFGDEDTFSLMIDNRSYLVESAPVRPERGEYFARVLGRHYEVDVLDELLLAARAAERAQEHTGTYVMQAPMPGLVVHVHAKPGARVEAGQPLVIMEAMKMRNELAADVAGVVRSVAVAAGDKVDSRAALVTIERE